MKRKNLGTKLVAAGLTAALLLTGCGGNSSSGQATGSTAEGTTQSTGEEERPTITVAVSMNEKENTPTPIMPSNILRIIQA